MRREYDKYHLISVFCAVVDHGSLSKAGSHLGLSAPTVSKTLAQLEQVLGQVLLIRTTRSVSVTDAGRLVYQQGQQIINAFTDLEDRVAEIGALDRGKLRLTFPETLGENVFSQICIDFQEAFPDFNLELIFTPHHLDMVEDDIDIAIRVWSAIPDSQFYALPLFHIHPIFVASPEYLKKKGHPDSIEELGKHNILLARLNGLKDGWLFNGKFYQFKGNLVSNKTTHIRAAAINGNGIAILPSYFCQPAIKCGQLIEIFPDLKQEVQVVGALYKVRRNSSKKIDLFLSFLERRLRKSDFDLLVSAESE
ncbi:LysR family transcriptional regulator [Microbulbifer variabilis]|uniref:LysR family transcriptional regulator n=1 Tax=Microbulbifer variabilis TaxID=266805 RepID=A0ABY4V887_9GAMM|nr:LysR family transcriptional regulator [Microbulbifer variabilis]USD19626.1 LysR family transcriptional regulator [Microbulbifer variabilis]